MLNTGIRTEGDFALSLLGEYTENKSVPSKTSAFMGLALSYGQGHDRSQPLFLRQEYHELTSLSRACWQR
jgi:hypothetical protein